MLVHCDAADAATKHMTKDAHVKIIRKTRSSKNKKQHAVGSEYIHIEVNGSQSTVYSTVGVRWELLNEFIAARNGKSPWSTTAFFPTVRKIKHHNVVSYEIFADEFPDKHPREWTKLALITLEEVMELYMLEVIA